MWGGGGYDDVENGCPFSIKGEHIHFIAISFKIVKRATQPKIMKTVSFNYQIEMSVSEILNIGSAAAGVTLVFLGAT